MALKYDKVTNFLREKLKAQIPIAPIAMEWLEEPNLAKTLYEMLQTDINLELHKQQLALKTDFSMHDVWAMFDLQAAGYISRAQFEEVYLLYGLRTLTDEIKLAFQYYDRDKDQLLSKEEFVSMIAPRDERYKDVVMKRKSLYEGK